MRTFRPSSCQYGDLTSAVADADSAIAHTISLRHANRAEIYLLKET
jgi:hypothetical protein